MSGVVHPKLRDEFSAFSRIRHTPISDLLRGECSARLSLAYTIDSANLPPPLPKAVYNLVRRTRLWKREQHEVARELIAHFQDGLEAGHTPEELLQSFGDPKQAALLIRRAKKRNRSLLWRTGRRGVQGLMLLPVVLVVLYIPIAIRFFAGSPTITHDYVKELNRTAASVPASQRAWPVYREALIGLPSLDSIVADDHDRPHPVGVRPGDVHWPAYEQFVVQHADRIAKIRHAASMPGMGFEAAARLSDEDQILWPSVRPSSQPGAADGSLLTVLLPHLGEFRNVGYLLLIDSRRAAAAGDARAVLEDLAAIMGIARHMREFPVLVGDLVSLAIVQMMLDRVGELLASQPTLFSDDQLQSLAHHIAGLGDDELAVRLYGERMFFYDIIQRTFTDNGRGDGRITFQGMRLFDSLITYANGSHGPLAEGGAIVAATPAMSLVVANRREMLDMYDRMMNELERNGERPLWERDSTSVGSQLGQWHASAIDQWRWMPLVRLMPAVDHATLQHHYVRGGRDGILAAIAIELYRRRHATWPESLGALTPSLLPAVPIDRFDGQPLRYRIVEGRPVIYSIGSDLDDDGGRPALRQADGKPENAAARKWRSREAVEQARRQRNFDQASSNWLPDGDWVIWPPSE